MPNLKIEESNSLISKAVIMTGEAPSAEAVPVSTTRTGQMMWKDTFYAGEPDIEAVFDVDTEAIQLYQSQASIKYGSIAAGYSVLYAAFLAMGLYGIASVCLVIAFVFGVLTRLTCKRATAAFNTGGIHMAITSSCVRYDQEKPMVSTAIAVQDITTCTVEQRELKPYCGLFGTNKTINLIHLRVANGSSSKRYVGVKDPRNFARLVMTIKNRPRSAAPPVASSEIVFR
ncbi:expressed unknown protein [Seminavis robusta]|uniref:Uncharacterized protein n=1 Tax=Seminavis robusta TaxID=568900 RepID=A0A9N8H6U0_9STRA|nr:expressed unknown protein [Seminavis robusta]|eukprot:Sro122_g059060.1 n/a (229) ;mRNA; r:8858-9634